MSDILDDLKMMADHCDQENGNEPCGLGMLLIRAIAEIRKLRQQPVSAVEVPMPEENILKIRALDSAEVRWIDREALRTYGNAREAAGVAAGGKDAERLDWLSRQFVTVRIPMRYGSKVCITGMPTDDDGESKPWDIRAAIDAALRREVK